jgi:hypothetical protein
MMVNKLKKPPPNLDDGLAFENKRRCHPDALGGGRTGEAVITISITGELICIF